MRPDWVENCKKYNVFESEPAQCTGTLTVSLHVTRGCCCGDPPSELAVHFTCTECGPIEFDPAGLPDAYGFQEWVNLLLERTEALPYDDPTTKGRRLTDARNRAVEAVMAEKGISMHEAYEEVLNAELQTTKQSKKS